ncbi:flagellin protein [Aurantimonas manganoxydans SI85-9A1]|uniref:Flagellin n=1 Tax=Aurantimonas manganoxydans (strain ATCC BAA-1229 / DSM 21871 / SI85-9A1) TaxID=287752 RepID=Q1YLM2_AURMS|nr:flagellin [Aurantimonas manganoxydans]EAS51709.1 flagellin protein [Aurantimonas manganoxydans SI85-9A1]
MTSINTNIAAMAALQTLQATNRSMDATQNRISTGFRVAEAKDNAAYWSIATTMRSDNKALSAVEDSLGLGAAKVDIAYTALESAIDVVDEIKAKLVAASEPGVDKTKIQSEISELKKQLQSIASSASFSGENWLQNDASVAAGSKDIVASFNRDSTGAVSIGTITVDVTAMTLIGTVNETTGVLTKNYHADGISTPIGDATDYVLLDAGATGTAASGTEIALTGTTTTLEISSMIKVVDAILKDMTNVAANLGAAKSRIELQQNFVSNLTDSISSGIGALVDADMTEESTRLKALQTQQQLGVQALSIANSSSQAILQLFQN